MDLSEKMVNALIAHWPFVAGFMVLGWWGLPHLIKKTLLNGGGDVIRLIVTSCNDAQTAKHRDEMESVVRRAIAEHEEVEAERIGRALADFRAEITGSHRLPPSPRAGVPLQPTLRRRRRRS